MILHMEVWPMFFNLLKSSLLCLLCVSCSNDNLNFSETSMNLSLDFDASCLDKLPRFFELYFENKVTPQGIDRNLNCAIEAIDYIKLRVAGDEKEKYSVNEVRGFANRFLFKGEPKDFSFFKQFIFLKKELLGGSEDFISFKELDDLKFFIVLGKALLKEVSSQAEELVLKKTFSNQEEIEESVLKVAAYFNKLLNFHPNKITKRSLTFLAENFMEIDEREAQSWFSILNLILGGLAFDSELQKEELLPEAFERYYLSVIQLNKKMESSWAQKREDFDSLSIEVDAVFDHLQWSLNNRADKPWTEEEIFELFYSINKNEVLLKSISEKTLRHLIQVVFGKYFMANEEKVVFSTVTVEKLRQAFFEFKRFVNESEAFEGYEGLDFPFKLSTETLFAKYSRQRWPSVINDKMYFNVDTVPLLQKFTFESLFHTGWQFVAADLLVSAYSESGTGLSLDETKWAYLDIFELLVELDILSESGRGGWFRIFNEGNLLIPSADPNGEVDVAEIAEYFSYMFSAYFAGEDTYENLLEGCPNAMKECVFYQFTKPDSNVFFTMPKLVDFLTKSASIDSFNLWSESFEYIAKLDVNPEPYTKNMFFRGVVGSQYVEVLFRKYDLDQSMTFSFQETERAYEDFKFALRLLPQVKGTIAENNDRLLKAFFTFFVDEGRLPKITNGRPSGAFVRYYARCGLVSSKSCNFESDRSSIMAVLAYLTSVDLQE